MLKCASLYLCCDMDMRAMIACGYHWSPNKMSVYHSMSVCLWVTHNSLWIHTFAVHIGALTTFHQSFVTCQQTEIMCNKRLYMCKTMKCALYVPVPSAYRFGSTPTFQKLLYNLERPFNWSQSSNQVLPYCSHHKYQMSMNVILWNNRQQLSDLVYMASSQRWL